MESFEVANSKFPKWPKEADEKALMKQFREVEKAFAEVQSKAAKLDAEGKSTKKAAFALLEAISEAVKDAEKQKKADVAKSLMETHGALWKVWRYL
jgi:hypothetical protein